MINQHTTHSQFILVFISLSLVLSGCRPSTQVAPVSLPSPIPQPTIQANEGLQVWFTDPTSTHAKDYEGGPDKPLAAAIDAAKLSVDVAAYSLNLWSVEDALIRAHKRGLPVRIVMESDNMSNPEVKDLKAAGIPIVGDQQEGLMHDKFMVLDGSEVWTGSMNYTASGTYKDNSVLILIRSEVIAKRYTSEFEAMFLHHFFTPGKTAMPSVPYVYGVAKTRLELYFSPADTIAPRIVELINSAQESINFLAYSFTSNAIGEAIMARAKAGVRVAGVMDDTQVKASSGTEYDPFKQAGLDVRLDGNEDGLMHHKLIIIDRKIVITGSYNFSASAENSNNENLLVINDPVIAAQFLDQFQKIYDQAQAPSN